MPTTAEKYRALRATGNYPAINAWRQITAEDRTDPLARTLHAKGFGQYGHDVETWKADGFTFRATIQPDDDAEPDFLGTFTDDWSEDVIVIRPRCRGDWKYFLPANTERSHYESLRDMHYGRTRARELARQYVRQDFERARSYGRDWNMYGVTVTISRAGVELGCDSLWGIDAEPGDSYWADVAAELVGEALAHAKATLAKLCTVDA